MATIDLTRSATDYKKHYKSVRAFQGRVLLDDDHNENERIHGEDERRSRVHIIGPSGSPDDGFKIANATINAGKIDFDILPGTMYVGGYAVELEQVEKFQKQADWLQLTSASLPGPPAAGTRRDLVVLEVRLQAVSPTEDAELFEHAVGPGGDTAGRMKLVRRVRVIENVSSAECQVAWNAVLAQWAALGLGTLNEQNELVTDAKLKVDFVEQEDADLCSPPVQDGYLGADNQAIRVQLVSSNQFVWGFNNATPGYRVQVTGPATAQPAVKLLTKPKDQEHWPRAGQIVEILPWGAQLPNNEKVAEFSGHLARIASSYDPNSETFTITGALPGGAAFGQGWFPPPAAGDAFFFMRVWDRGTDTASAPAINFGAAPVTLGQTGLTVTFTGTHKRPHDYWIIAARPETPQLIVPWDFKTGHGPHGYRRFFSVLSIIEWTAGAPNGQILHDCRDTFLPLVRQKGCCTYTVGDGVNSFGKFTSIQKAIDSLPAEGGEICLLPGVFVQNFIIQGGAGIRIHGCGSKTILRDKSDGNAPIASILDSNEIELDSFRVEAPGTIGILVRGRMKRPCIDIDIHGLEMEARDRFAIICRYVRKLRIEHCDISLLELAEAFTIGKPWGNEPAVFMLGQDMLFERNEIRNKAARSLVSAMGGLQVGGGSLDVQIRRNLISGGNGNGITLGSIVYIPEQLFLGLGDDYEGVIGKSISPFGIGFVIDENGCIHPDPDPKDPKDPEGGPLIPVSEGDVRRVRIIDNVIEKMGNNGIATVRFFKEAAKLIRVIDLQVRENRIMSCLQLDRPNLLPVDQVYYGYGGIALSSVDYLLVSENRIEDNGVNFVDATCGIFVLRGAGVIVEANVIKNNGPLTATQQQAASGARGGIYVYMGLVPTVGAILKDKQTFDDGFPTLRVHANVVIQPMGPALHSLMFGSAFVEGNELTSLSLENLPASNNPLDLWLLFMGGHAVRLLNFSTTFEVAGIVKFLTIVGAYPNTNPTGTAGASPSYEAWIPQFYGGHITFNDNEVLLQDRMRSLADVLSSVLLFCLGDISIDANKMSADLRNTDIITNLFGWAMSLRATSNRFIEWFLPLRASAITGAQYNQTSLNQGTRCIIVMGLPTMKVNMGNKTSYDLTKSDACASLEQLMSAQFKALGW